ncbi:hypothetical protein BGW80DRAFT_1258085 [Lactifluus volemus]|nr:hypothetical protein BGW80DRAFT_1258085 [Lactifluus volemus]
MKVRATFSLDPSETPKLPKWGACTQCKGCKVKCTYKEAASACQKCISAGLEHSCTQIAGVMAPDPSISRRPSRFSQFSHKSTSPCLPSNAPEYAHQSTTLRSHDRIRESLSEGQDHYTLPTIAEEQLTEDPDPIISFQSFIDLERMQPQASSDVSHDDDFGLASTQFESDTDDNDVLGPAIQPSNSPPMRPKPVRLGTEHRAADHAPGHPDSQAPAAPQDYDHDPSTCDFEIFTVMTKQDGSNCPFTIKSFTSFKQLRDLPKTPATSIHSMDELKIFQDRMHLLIVPQRLASGKILSRHLRPVTICFEDGSNTDQSSSQSTSRPGATSADKQKVAVADLQQRWKCLLHSKTKETFCWQSPQSNSICYEFTFTQLGLWAMEIVRGNATIDEKPENLHLNIAWPRAHAASVLLQIAPQVYPEHGIALITPNAAATTCMPVGYPAVPAYPGPVPQTFATALPQVPGPYMSQTMMGGMGQYCYSLSPLDAFWDILPHLLSHDNQRYERLKFVAIAAPFFPSAFSFHALSCKTSQPPIIHPSMPFSHSLTLRAEKNPSDYPDIPTWFRYLDVYPGQNRGHIKFEPLAASLVKREFVCITQLATDLVTCKDLEKWLGVKIGMAVLIKQNGEWGDIGEKNGDVNRRAEVVGVDVVARRSGVYRPEE